MSTDIRTRYVQGLRAAADFFESNPDVPLPFTTDRVTFYCVTAKEFFATCEALGTTEVRPNRTSVEAVRHLHGMDLVVQVEGRTLRNPDLSIADETVEAVRAKLNLVQTPDLSTPEGRQEQAHRDGACGNPLPDGTVCERKPRYHMGGCGLVGAEPVYGGAA